MSLQLNANTLSSDQQIVLNVPYGWSIALKDPTYTYFLVDYTGFALKGASGPHLASAGLLGEYQFMSGQAINMTSGSYIDALYMDLTPGEWDITGVWFFYTNGCTWNATGGRIEVALGLNAGSDVSDTYYGESRLVIMQPTSGTVSANSVSTRFRRGVSSNARYRLKYFVNFTGGPAVFSGIISARRVN